MKCHPDIYGDDPEKVKEFREVQDAYDRVINWDKEKPHFDSSASQKQRKKQAISFRRSETATTRVWE